MDTLWHTERDPLGQGGSLHERLGVDLHAKSSQQRLLSGRGVATANLGVAKRYLVSETAGFRSETPVTREPKDEQRR